MKAQKAIVCILSSAIALVSFRKLSWLSADTEDADLAAISISTVIAGEDGSFATTVNLEQLPETGLCALDFAVAYDSAALEISEIALLYDTGAEAAEIAVDPDFEGTVFSYEALEGELRVRWATALKNADYWLREERPLLQISGTVCTDTPGSCSWLRIIPATRETYEGSGILNTKIVAGHVDADGNTYNCETECKDGAVWQMLDESGATMYGDVNMDAQRDVSDAVLIYRLMNEETLTLGAAAYANADCEPDGLLTIADVTLMLRYLEGQIEDTALGAG